jgi:hypothetical protein
MEPRGHLQDMQLVVGDVVVCQPMDNINMSHKRQEQVEFIIPTTMAQHLLKSFLLQVVHGLEYAALQVDNMSLLVRM